jgi:hypothetical protein
MMDMTTLNRRAWEELVYANMRACYFGDLLRVYQQRDKWIRVIVLVLTSGSMATAMLTLGESASGHWVRILPSLFATAGSLWLLLSQYSTLSRDASDLAVAWQGISAQYETLWNDLQDPDAAAVFDRIYGEAGKLSRQGAKFPQSGKRLERSFNYSVEMKC